MNNQLQEALKDYYMHRSRAEVELQPDGLYTPPADNTCPLCAQARWSCSTGAHLKQPEHYALKYDIDVKLFLRACEPLAFGPSNIAWKKVDYIESSYLTSSQDFKWLPKEVAWATCNVGCEEIPGDNCGCGLYFFWSPWEALDYWGNGILIKCEIGGLVKEASKGCRAECAVIRGIYHENQSERALALAEMYQVPLVDLMEDYDVRVNEL